MLYWQSKEKERQYSRIDPQATTTTKQNGVMHDSVLSVDNKWVRAINDVQFKHENKELGRHEVSCTARGLFFFPVGALVETVIVSCACPSSSASFFPSAGPTPRRRFRVPDCTFSIRTPSSLSSLVRSCNNCTSFETEFGVTAVLAGPAGSPTTSGADPPRFGHPADVILTVIVVVVGYEEARRAN